MPADTSGVGVGYDISPKSSIFADTRAEATSGGAFGMAGNPNLAAVFGGSSMPSWLIPAAAIVAALAVAGFFLVRRSGK